MLVMRRKQGDKIRLGTIEITILETRQHLVKLGVDAPAGVDITTTKSDTTIADQGGSRERKTD